MKIAKLLENISKGKIENNTRFKIDNEKEITYIYDEELQKSYFIDDAGQEINIMNCLHCNFEPILEKKTKPGGICLYYEELDDYSYDTNPIAGFYNTAEGYYDAALTMIEDYHQRFETLYDIGNLNKNAASSGYYQDSIIRTLLAFSCECYLKALLLNQGKNLKDLKKLNHGLIGLYNELDNDTFSDIFLDMEKNDYNIMPYNSPYLPFDNPDLTEKFMIDLAIVDDAFVDSRYCAEKDKNTNYTFLYRFAKSLRNVSEEKLKITSIFNDGKHIKK